MYVKSLAQCVAYSMCSVIGRSYLKKDSREQSLESLNFRDEKALRDSLGLSSHFVEEATEAQIRKTEPFSNLHMIDLYTEPEQIICKWIC